MVHLRVQRLAGLHAGQGAVAALQVLDHHLAEAVAHVHLDTDQKNFVCNTVEVFPSLHMSYALIPSLQP